jgi:hypothetical protein
MSLERQLLIIFMCFLSFLTVTQATFMTLQRVLIRPSQHPALVKNRVLTDLNQPVAVTIPHKPESLHVVPSLIQNGEWSVSDQGVSLLKNPAGGPQGHILYGHNWNSVLGQLQQAQIGEEISLTYQNGTEEVFVINSIFTVSSDRLDVLELAQPQKLLMYTCAGFLDTKRLVVLASRKNPELSLLTR